MKSEIIAVGSEMLTPARQDTNSLYLTEKLNELGAPSPSKPLLAIVKKTSSTPSARPSDALTSSSSSVAWPTEDDLTREAVAKRST